MIELPADQWYHPGDPDPVTVTLDHDSGIATATDQFGRVTLGFDGARRPSPPGGSWRWGRHRVPSTAELRQVKDLIKLCGNTQ